MSMSKEQFIATVEAKYPDQYYFHVSDCLSLGDGTKERIYAIRYQHLITHPINKIPRMSLQWLYLSDYALFDGEIKKERWPLNGEAV